MTRYWNEWQTKEMAKEKKPMKTRKKQEAEMISRDDEKHERSRDIC
jgi:hypothetical protein